MPLDPVDVIAALHAASRGSLVRVWMSRGPPASPPQLPWDDVFFVDAGFLSSARASLVKIAVLHRRHHQGGVEERLYTPVVPGGGVLGLYLEIDENLRGALAYVAELAMLLSLATGSAFGGLNKGARVGEKKLLVRHGPLLQQVNIYLSPSFNVDPEVARAVLRYTGLDAGTVGRLLQRSSVCGSSRVNLGLLATRLLEEMAQVAQQSKGKIAFAGIVEDTSKSKTLLASLLAELLQHALWTAQRYYAAAVAGALSSSITQTLSRLVQQLQGCWCAGAPGPLGQGRLLHELVAPVLSTLATRLRWSPASISNPVPRLALLEAAVTHSGVLPDIKDSELLYSLRFLGPCSGGGCVYTAPRPRGGTAAWTEVTLLVQRRDYGCHGKPGEVAKPLYRVLYSYVLPGEAPDCATIKSIAGSGALNYITPCDLAEAITTVPAVRVEAITSIVWDDFNRLLDWVYWASSILLYGYPAPLLVVDAASRITPQERLGLERLAASLARRRQPYAGFLRGWRSRVSMV